MDTALTLARTIAGNAPLVVRASKELIYGGQRAMGMDSALTAANRAFAPVSGSNGCQGGVPGVDGKAAAGLAVG